MNVDRSCFGANDRQQLDIRPTQLGWSKLRKLKVIESCCRMDLLTPLRGICLCDANVHEACVFHLDKQLPSVYD